MIRYYVLTTFGSAKVGHLGWQIRTEQDIFPMKPDTMS